MIKLSPPSQLSSIPPLYREPAKNALSNPHSILGPDLTDRDFVVFVEENDALNDLGPPEESVLTRIECCGEIRIFHRLVYATEIILFEESDL